MKQTALPRSLCVVCVLLFSLSISPPTCSAESEGEEDAGDVEATLVVFCFIFIRVIEEEQQQHPGRVSEQKVQMLLFH